MNPLRPKQIEYRNLKTLKAAKNLGILKTRKLDENEYDTLWEREEAKQLCEVNTQPYHRSRCDAQGNRVRANFGLDDLIDPSAVCKGLNPWMPNIAKSARKLVKKPCKGKLPFRPLGMGVTINTIDNVARSVVALDKLGKVLPMILKCIENLDGLFNTIVERKQFMNLVQMAVNEIFVRNKECIFYLKTSYERDNNMWGSEKRAIERFNRRNKNVKLLTPSNMVDDDPIMKDTYILKFLVLG